MLGGLVERTIFRRLLEQDGIASQRHIFWASNRNLLIHRCVGDQGIDHEDEVSGGEIDMSSAVIDTPFK